MFGSLASILIFNNARILERLSTANILKNSALIVLFACLIWFDEAIPHSSLITLVPVLATLILIVIPASDSLAHKLLTLRQVFTGLISYSLYLWHQPLLVFNRYISAKPDIIIRITILLAAFLLAYVSWRYVEKPFRHRNLASRKQVYSLCAISLAAITGFGFHAGKDGIPSRYSSEQQTLLSYLHYNAPAGQAENNAHCSLGDDESYEAISNACFNKGNVLLWGDSHANALAKGLRYQLGKQLSEITSSACLPVVDTHFPHRKHCQATNQFAIQYILQGQFDTVILYGNWLSHEDKLASLGKTLAALQTINANVIVIGGVPQYLPDLPSFLLTKRLLLNESAASTLAESTLYPEIESLDHKLTDVIKQYSNIKFVSALNTFCESPQQCRVLLPSETQQQQWVPAAWDYDHLTHEGAILLSRELKLSPGENNTN